MLTESNKERLEQEILGLIGLIAEGREAFFEKSGYSLHSSDNFVNHWIVKELFQANLELTQLELNIQLLYIKLASYYRITSAEKDEKIIKARNAFAHELSDLIFSKKVKYNFFLHKVTENFKKLVFIFYKEEGTEKDAESLTLDLDLHKDIGSFLSAVTGNTVEELEKKFAPNQ